MSRRPKRSTLETVALALIFAGVLATPLLTASTAAFLVVVCACSFAVFPYLLMTRRWWGEPAQLRAVPAGRVGPLTACCSDHIGAVITADHSIRLQRDGGDEVPGAYPPGPAGWGRSGLPYRPGGGGRAATI